MFNEIVAVVVSAFAKPGKEADKNGSQNVYLNPIAGKIPNTAMVVAGTVAERAGLIIGKTLMVMISEGEPQEYQGAMVRRFNHTVLGEVKPTEILGLRKELGASVVVATGNAVEDNTTNDILGGNGAGNAATPVLQPTALADTTAAPVVTPAPVAEVKAGA